MYKTTSFGDSLTILAVELALFDGQLNPNTTADAGLAPEMKTYYEKVLIDLAEAELIFDQFGQVKDIPKGNGKTIEFRQFDPLPEMTEPLTEGITPDGQSMSVKALTATVAQYGGYVTYTDVLELTAFDPILSQGTKLIASQAGRTMDTITRDVLAGGTNVQYAEGQVDSRAELSYTDETTNHNLTVNAIRKAVRYLEGQNAPRINGYYVGIVHPNTKYDIMDDPKWRSPHEYVDTEHIYRNEIGEMYGVRFVESSRAPIFKGEGADDADVYATLILADDAYGVTSVTGGGLQHIVKPKGSGGTSDPLDQRGTIGWKGLKTAEILIPQYIVRIETTATP